MGTMQHHAILVTGLKENAERAWEQAKAIFPMNQITDVQGPVENNYFSFAILPDGSKEYWPQSEEGDERRAKFLDWLQKDAQTYFKEATWGELDQAKRRGPDFSTFEQTIISTYPEHPFRDLALFHLRQAQTFLGEINPGGQMSYALGKDPFEAAMQHLQKLAYRAAVGYDAPDRRYHILNSLWFHFEAGIIETGVVAVRTNEHEPGAPHIWKAYMGLASGKSQDADQQHIAAYGEPLRADIGQAFFPELAAHWKYKED